jgi:tyrosyl-tRNA synthetase
MGNDEISIIKRMAVQIFSEEDFQKKLESGKKLVIKFGADPSRPDLHLGHSVPIRMLRHFQKLGHEIVFVIGDFTAMIGDPSGKSKTRPALTFEETRKAGETYFEQITKILDKEKTKIVYNSQWLEKLKFEDIIKLTSKYTVARILERDDFKNRYENNLPLSIHELLYPLMQGYDSVALNADIEIGGTEQTFNLLVGRELQRDYGQEAQVVLTFPLLVGIDGKEKMSKSLGNYIGLSESPDTMFEKSMRIPDDVLEDYFKLTTDFSEKDIKDIMSKGIREAHVIYGKEIIKMYHGEEKIEDAIKRYEQIAKGALPENIKEIHLNQKLINICDLLVQVGFASSKSEAKRMIAGNGVKVNSDIISDINTVIELDKEAVLQFGKNKFVKISY